MGPLHRWPVVAGWLRLLFEFLLQRLPLANILLMSLPLKNLLLMGAVVPVNQFIKRLTLALKFSTCVRKLFT